MKIKQAIFGVAAATAIALLPMTPAMAGGHGFRPLQPFGFGRGIVGAAVALATLPLVIASSVVAGVGDSGASYPTQGYAGPAYGYAPYPGHYAAPRVAYGPRGYYAARHGNYGRGYYRPGGNPYPRR